MFFTCDDLKVQLAALQKKGEQVGKISEEQWGLARQYRFRAEVPSDYIQSDPFSFPHLHVVCPSCRKSALPRPLLLSRLSRFAPDEREIRGLDSACGKAPGTATKGICYFFQAEITLDERKEEGKMPERQHATWGELLRKAVEKPGRMLEAYTAFHNYSFGNALGESVWNLHINHRV